MGADYFLGREDGWGYIQGLAPPLVVPAIVVCINIRRQRRRQQEQLGPHCIWKPSNHVEPRVLQNGRACEERFVEVCSKQSSEPAWELSLCPPVDS